MGVTKCTSCRFGLSRPQGVFSPSTHFTDGEKADKWAKVVAPVWTDGVKDIREGERPAPVQSALTLSASIIGTGKALSRPLEGKRPMCTLSRRVV